MLGICGVTLFKFVSLHQHTPIHWAARRGHVNTAQLLVENGADINVEDKAGVSE